jgi:hypothetical protein
MADNLISETIFRGHWSPTLYVGESSLTANWVREKNDSDMFNLALIEQVKTGSSSYLVTINDKYGTVFTPDTLTYDRSDLKIVSTVEFYTYDKLTSIMPLESASELMQLETKLGVTLKPVFALAF